MAHLKILGEAWINENPWFITNPNNLEAEGYKPYYFLGKNIKVDQEDIEKYGRDSFFVLGKGENNLVFTKRYLNGMHEKEKDIANMIPCNKELDWDNPMFILEKYSDRWTIRPNSEGEKYLE